jgi:DNA-binding transcriptional LysR family regulator
MDRLTAMRVLVEVAKLGSFAEAARSLRISTSAASRHVGQLEEHLGVRLLHRTTRSVAPTPTGQAYLAGAERLLGELGELESSVRGDAARPQGTLRVTAGVSFTNDRLHAVITEFLTTWPEVRVELDLTDRHVDLVAEGIDVAVRIGQLPDSDLVARRIAPVEHPLVAAPAYLARAGTPSHPSELRDHDRLLDRNQPRDWRLEGPDGQVSVPVDGRFAANSATAVLDACRAGLGIAIVPSFAVAPALAAGEVVRVLPDWAGPTLTLYAVYPTRRHLSAAVRAFVDLLVRSLGDRLGGAAP